MPDQPTPSPADWSDEERREVLHTMAFLLLESLEKEDAEDERYDEDGRLAFAEGFRIGVLFAADVIAFGIGRVGRDFDPAWPSERISDWIDARAFELIARREQIEVELSLHRILREQEDDDA